MSKLQIKSIKRTPPLYQYFTKYMLFLILFLVNYAFGVTDGKFGNDHAFRLIYYSPAVSNIKV